MSKTMAALAVCTALFSSSSLAGLVNPGFETGDLSGWTLLGQGHADDATFGVTPTHGTYMGFIDNTGNGSLLATDIVADLGVPGSQIAAFGLAGPPTRGTAIYQDVTVATGDTMTFDWNFLTIELTEDPTFDDFAFFSVGNSAFMLASRNTSTFTTPSPAAGYEGLTGWSTQSYTFTTAGTYRVGFGVINVTDSGHDSALLLDAVVVPEPAMTGVVVIALAALQRRRARVKAI